MNLVLLLILAFAELAVGVIPAVADGERLPEDMARAKAMADVVAGPVQSGPIEATGDSIKSIECPKWFRDAKFGIWSHWGPGCISGVSQNYARDMYEEGSWANTYHIKHFGDPKTVGYKDILKYWTAANWDPDALIKKYKSAGAKYFVSMGRHHDNVDLYDSKYTPWNSVNIGPHKDVAGLWEVAAKKEGMYFGMSFHPNGSYYWSGQKNDKLAPYDTADSRYWSLYMPPSGTAGADAEFNDGVYARIKDAIDKYEPDLLYFDGGIPNAEASGYKLMAHFFNSNIKLHGGGNDAVLALKSNQGGVRDLERGEMKDITAQPWQCDTSESSWFYLDEPAAADELYTFHRSPTTMLHLLIDVVSKNGNLLMNIPQRADGTIDEHCEIMLVEFSRWMKINSEGIFGTRPWGVYGEGPSQLPRSELNDLKSPMTSRDIRFTTKGNVLYALVLGWPADHTVTIKSLATPAGKIGTVRLLGHEGQLHWRQSGGSLVVTLPSEKPCDHAVVLKILGSGGQFLKPATIPVR